MSQQWLMYIQRESFFCSAFICRCFVLTLNEACVFHCEPKRTSAPAIRCELCEIYLFVRTKTCSSSLFSFFSPVIFIGALFFAEIQTLGDVIWLGLCWWLWRLCQFNIYGKMNMNFSCSWQTQWTTQQDYRSSDVWLGRLDLFLYFWFSYRSFFITSKKPNYKSEMSFFKVVAPYFFRVYQSRSLYSEWF